MYEITDTLILLKTNCGGNAKVVSVAGVSQVVVDKLIIRSRKATMNLWSKFILVIVIFKRIEKHAYILCLFTTCPTLTWNVNYLGCFFLFFFCLSSSYPICFVMKEMMESINVLRGDSRQEHTCIFRVIPLIKHLYLFFVCVCSSFGSTTGYNKKMKQYSTGSFPHHIHPNISILQFSKTLFFPTDVPKSYWNINQAALNFICWDHKSDQYPALHHVHNVMLLTSFTLWNCCPCICVSDFQVWSVL